MMLSVSASHFSTVLCPMLYIKENFVSFWQNYSTRKTLYANCLKNILLTNWILCTNICLV